MSERPRVLYSVEPQLDVAEFRRVLVESGLGTSRPVDNEERLASMLNGAGIVVTARLDQPGTPLVGVARGLSDLAWSCYLSEVAVSSAAQGLGIGKGLLDEVRRQLGDGVSVILLSVPEAVGFYERAGMTGMPHAFWYARTR